MKKTKVVNKMANLFYEKRKEYHAESESGMKDFYQGILNGIMDSVEVLGIFEEWEDKLLELENSNVKKQVDPFEFLRD